MPTFRTRARTLDMLGRQQIAGISTAISELFKNAHDAYADHVEIDYYRSDGLLVLRDDGVGMSKEDFENRWLTVGTESKFDPDRLPPRFPKKKIRPMLGEKGIGRLAVATLGPQLLILSQNFERSDLVAAFLNWGIFAWPGIDLEDITIPLRTFPTGTLPTMLEVSEMVGEFRNCATRVSDKVSCESFHKLMEELDQFNIDPVDIDSYLQKPSLKNYQSGTHFIIKPATSLLKEEIDGNLITEKVTPLKKTLLGFCNTMNPDQKALIKTAFRDYKTEELFDDLISDEEFFTPKEFEDADHRILGKFDKFGQFQGEIYIYGKKQTNRHVIPWSGSKGTHTDCGGFSVDFAAFEGEPKYSTIPDEEYSRLSRKSDWLGGLYIYRNGIRILPYGSSNFDWLNIELRRSKGTGYYYFSHRKMFGFLEIDSSENKALIEKAGREGFQENKAFRQYRSILENFFIQLAADFFRKESVYYGYEEKKKELSREEAARKKRKEKVKEVKKQFIKDLNFFFVQCDDDKPQEEANALKMDLKNKLLAVREISEIQSAASKIIMLEQTKHSEIRELEGKYKISRPRIGLNKEILRDWEAYKSSFSSLLENVFNPLKKRVDELISDEIKMASIALNRQVRTEAALDGLNKEVQKKTKETGSEVQKEANKVASKAKMVATQSLIEVESEFREVMSEFQRMDLASMPDESFKESRSKFEERIQKVTEKQGALLRSLKEQLEAIEFSDTISTVDQLGAIEQRNILLEEQAEVDSQLAQLGMAIEIIDHEFSGTVRSIRTNLRQLKAWADINQDLEKLYENMRNSFDHLDGYLTLFTPLQRRLYRKEVEIHGHRLSGFIQELFKARMARHEITLTTTKAFSNAMIIGFPSSFYPVFVNLVDNAIFWVSQKNPSESREIKLDCQNDILLVSDNGPGIDLRDREAIFELGFSRKPGGRGMGLHIGRETLRRVDFDLQLIDGDSGATFGILKNNIINTGN